MNYFNIIVGGVIFTIAGLLAVSIFTNVSVPYNHIYRPGDSLYVLTDNADGSKLCERVVVKSVADKGPGVEIEMKEGVRMTVNENYLRPSCRR
jgi:hypothetical protein